MAEYVFKTQPYQHQLEAFLAYRDKAAHAHFWDPRTGKSKITIDEAAYNHERGRINGALVLAPNGVHTNWVRNEIPIHCPQRFPLHAFAYSSSRATTKSAQASLRDCVTAPGLSWLTMTYEALTTERGAAAAKEFLSKRDVLYVPDEIHRIKTYTAKRTRYVLASGKLAKMLRGLTGTPVTNSPFDVYCPVLFLDRDFWKQNGFGGLTAFKTHFGVWEKGYARGKSHEFQRCVAYRNLPQLREMLTAISDRVNGDDVLDMPPAVYDKLYVEMTPQQARVYKELRDQYVTELSGETVVADLAITRLLRLQQIICGYLPAGDDGHMITIPGGNPRLDGLVDRLNDIGDVQTIIWARFKQDIDQITEAIKAGGGTCVRYDGSVKEHDRTGIVERFQSGKAQFFVGNSQMGEGIPLFAARNVVYYSNSFKLLDRIQTEDRPKVKGKVERTGITDIVCAGTVDERLIDALRFKYDVASQVTGDKLREWL